MKAARLALDAERDRFRLGEGRSRQVLDAQKDLTKAMQRQNQNAASLLRTVSDYEYATGYSAANRTPAAPPERSEHMAHDP